MKNLPLKGLTVLEFSQYLSGPSAGLRLADLGARVIKIEKPGKVMPAGNLLLKIYGLTTAVFCFIQSTAIRKVLPPT